MWSNWAQCSKSRTNWNSSATRFSYQTTLRLYPNCSARKLETCWHTHTTLVENIKKIRSFVLIYLALFPTQTVRMSWNNRSRWVGTGWQGVSCLFMDSKKQREEKLHSQANAFGGQQCGFYSDPREAFLMQRPWSTCCFLSPWVAHPCLHQVNWVTEMLWARFGKMLSTC